MNGVRMVTDGSRPDLHAQHSALVRQRGARLTRMWQADPEATVASLARGLGITERQAHYAIRKHGVLTAEALQARMAQLAKERARR